MPLLSHFMAQATQPVNMVVNQSLELFRGFLRMMPQIGIGLLVLLMTAVVAGVASRMSRGVLGRARLRRSLQDLLRQLLYITIWVVGILAACVIVFPTLTPGRLLATLGLTSIAIGFAFKDIFENFFAGILILWRFPIEIGDFIECESITGKVEDITIRMTLIRQVDGQLVVVPNGFLFKNPVRVLTNLTHRRTTITCGVAYGEDVNASREVIAKAVGACESIDPNKPVEIFANEFADSSINFEVTWWTGSTPLDVRRSRDEVVAAVKAALDEAGIEIPFPYRTLTFKEPLLTRREGDSHEGP